MYTNTCWSLQSIFAMCILQNHKDVSNVAKIVFHLLLIAGLCRRADLEPNLVSLLVTSQILALWFISGDSIVNLFLTRTHQMAPKLLGLQASITCIHLGMLFLCIVISVSTTMLESKKKKDLCKNIATQYLPPGLGAFPYEVQLQPSWKNKGRILSNREIGNPKCVCVCWVEGEQVNSHAHTNTHAHSLPWSSEVSQPMKDTVY